MEVGHEFGGGQWLRMLQMYVQGVDQRRAFLHNPHTSVFVSVNAAFMSFRLAKPAFQVEVVAGLVLGLPTHEQARLKTGHDLAHLLLNQIIIVPKAVT